MYNETINNALKGLAALLESKGNYLPESGECAEFALALCRALGWGDDKTAPRFSICIRSAFDSDGEFLYKTASHWVLNCPNDPTVDFDWKGCGASDRWESRWDDYTDEDGETSEFEWHPVSINDMESTFRKWNPQSAFDAKTPGIKADRVAAWENMIRDSLLEYQPRQKMRA